MDGERIIVASGLNAGEFLKNLSNHGVKSFNLRIFSPVQLAEYAITRAGLSVESKRIDPLQERAVVAQAVRKDPYWEKVAESYKDLTEIQSALHRMRSLIAAENEGEMLRKILLDDNEAGSESAFRKKNEALYRVYTEYMRCLEEQDTIDAIGMIRKAMQADPTDWRTQIITLEEFPVEPVTAALIGKITEHSEYREISVRELLPQTSSGFHIDGYANCYGTGCETDHIIEDIYAAKKKQVHRAADECVVAVTDPAVYAQMFYDRVVMYDLPVAFGCGIPIVNSKPAELLSLYMRWKTVGFYGKTALNAMLDSGAFAGERFWADVFSDQEEQISQEELRGVLEKLRLTDDAAVNAERLKGIGTLPEMRKYAVLLQRVAECLELPVGTFLERYAVLRSSDGSHAGATVERLDQAALVHIRNQTQSVLTSGGALTDDTIQMILKECVCRQRAEEGCIYVTDIASAFGCIRSNLYIAGMTAALYPGRPRENSLLLDHDLERFGGAAERYTSQGRIREKQKRLPALLRMASAAGCRICISWPGWNAEELKENNVSSMVYEMYREEHPAASMEDLEHDTVEVGYFDPAVTAGYLVGDAYNKNLIIQKDDPEPEVVLRRLRKMQELWETELRFADMETEEAKAALEDREWTAEELDLYCNCKRRFLYQCMLQLSGEENEDSFASISALERGRLAHRMLRRMDCTKDSKDTFLRQCEEAYSEYLKTHPPLTEDIGEEKDMFLRMMETAYDYEAKDMKNSEIVAAGEISATDPDSGIRMKTMPDRLQKVSDGRCQTIDYLTGLSTEYDNGRKQLFSAYILDQSDRNAGTVVGFERRYIALDLLFRGNYPNQKPAVKKCLEEFRKTLENGNFTKRRLKDEEEDTTDGTDSYCSACPYCVLCGRERIL